MQVPQISLEETAKFSKQWTYNGVAITLDNTSIAFATDWSNLLLRQFAMLLAQASQAQQGPVVNNPQPEQKQIIEA